MKISEIEPGKNGIEVMGELIDKKEPIVKDTYKVCHFELADDSGSINLTLWNEDVEKFNKGDKVKISGGYCKIGCGPIFISFFTIMIFFIDFTPVNYLIKKIFFIFNFIMIFFI